MPTTRSNTWTINGSAWNWEQASPLALADMALSLPGTTGNYASTPDSPSNSVVSDIDLRVKVSADTWVAALGQVLISKMTSDPGRTFRWQIQATTGALLLEVWPTGSAASNQSYISSAVPSFTNGQSGWLRCTLDVDNGASGSTAKFYTSADGVTWAQLGTDRVLAGVIALADTTTQVEIGAGSAGTSLFLPGKIHYAEVRNGIDGPVVARFDPSAVARTGVRLPTTLTQPGGSPNLLTPNQASLETDTTGWVANTNCTIARSTAQFLDGAASLAVTATAIGTSAAGTLVGTSGIPVVAGKSYTPTASFRAAVTGRAVRVGINWYTAAGAYLSTTFSATTATDTASGWVTATGPVVAPATAAFAQVITQVNDVAQLAAEIHYVDRVSVVETPTVWTMNGAAWDWVDT